MADLSGGRGVSALGGRGWFLVGTGGYWAYWLFSGEVVGVGNRFFFFLLVDIALRFTMGDFRGGSFSFHLNLCFGFYR